MYGVLRRVIHSVWMHLYSFLFNKVNMNILKINSYQKMYDSIVRNLNIKVYVLFVWRPFTPGQMTSFGVPNALMTMPSWNNVTINLFCHKNCCQSIKVKFPACIKLLVKILQSIMAVMANKILFHWFLVDIIFSRKNWRIVQKFSKNTSNWPQIHRLWVDPSAIK